MWSENFNMVIDNGPYMQGTKKVVKLIFISPQSLAIVNIWHLNFLSPIWEFSLIFVGLSGFMQVFLGIAVLEVIGNSPLGLIVLFSL